MYAALYFIDDSPNTIITSLNYSNIVTEDTFLIDKPSIDKYLHVAVIDKNTRNLSGTVHVLIPANPGPSPVPDAEDEYVLSTSPITIMGHAYEYNNNYYVNADGITPFTLSFNGYKSTAGKLNSQINYWQFDYSGAINNGYYRAYLPNASIISPTLIYPYGTYFTEINEDIPIMDKADSIITRTDNCTNSSYNQTFVLMPEAEGTNVFIPRVGAHKIDSEVINWSNAANDDANKISIIGDATNPIVTGYEILDSVHNIDIEDYSSFVLNLKATDNISGLKEFYVNVMNLENAVFPITYSCNISGHQTEGTISIDILANPKLFNGNVKIEIVAIDNVGNEERIEKYFGTFSLSVSMSPKFVKEGNVGNNYLKGQVALLTVNTSGYAEKIVINYPVAFKTSLYPDYETTKEFIYSFSPEDYKKNPGIVQGKYSNTFEILIPIDTVENNYSIIVTAYKNGNPIEISPSTNQAETLILQKQVDFTVSGSIIEDLKTHIIY